MERKQVEELAEQAHLRLLQIHADITQKRGELDQLVANKEATGGALQAFNTILEQWGPVEVPKAPQE